ncbi:Cytokinin dehydrogenase, partial [Forsythia ovata]
MPKGSNEWTQLLGHVSLNSNSYDLIRQVRKDILWLTLKSDYLDINLVQIDDKLEVQMLQEGLNFIPGFTFTRDETYVDFLNRVRRGEITLKSKGLWDVPHPWLNLFVPKSHILDFNAGVFVDSNSQTKEDHRAPTCLPNN